MYTEDSFAHWQPIYAARGVHLFPVSIAKEAKRPLVRSYLKTSKASSERFVERFGAEKAFGFACGKASGITVVDIDSTDSAALDEARQLFGASPILIKTGGKGGFQIPYRFNGEGRQIRAVPGLPIDLLGAGYVVAPPSVGTVGQYQIVEGTLADLDRIPTANIPDFLRKQQAAPYPVSTGPTLEGQRHDALKARLNRDIWHVDTFEQLLDCGMTFGRHECEPPMLDVEITALADWFWTTKERGLLRRTGHRDWLADAVELMIEDRDAASILFYLRDHHPQSHTFYITNGLAKVLRMDRTRFGKKRRKLRDLGLIRQVAPPNQAKKKAALYAWP